MKYSRHMMLLGLALGMLVSALSSTGRTEPAKDLVKNGDFSTGTTSWGIQAVGTAKATFDTIKDGPAGKAALRIQIQQVGTEGWHVQLAQPFAYVAKPYVVSLWAKADAPRTISVGIQQGHTPYNWLSGGNLPLTTEWKQYSVLLPAKGQDDTNTRLLFSEMGKQTGTVYLAQCSLTEYQQNGGILFNGDFLFGLNSWLLEQNKDAKADTETVKDGPDGKSALRLKVITPGEGNWFLQLCQPIAVQAKAYTCTFWAKADTNRTLYVHLEQAHTPFQSLGDMAQVPLTAAWKQYTVTFVPKTADDKARIIFNGFGKAENTVWLTGVALTEQAAK
ncbi:MAG TPA: carbohydrate binding domain-containing protein [Armatimonadota bacterium]|nr:carbohydrate binding domain-containing protein [Armatimonadota bacterium]